MTQDPNPHHDSGVAIVTGAAGGIGAAIARRLAADGFAVGVVDLEAADRDRTVAPIRSAGGSAIPVAADVTDESAIDTAVRRVAADLGPPTVLVNNAGIGPPGDLLDLTTSQWDTVLGVNLRGAFVAARATAPHMVAAGWGRIINISSISAVRDPGRVHYASSKAGLLGFTKTLALQLGPHGITANAIAPGFVVSDMTRTSARHAGRSFDEHQRVVAASIPVGRVGQPEDIAHTASYLAHPAAGFVSGQVIYVAGGPVD